MDVETDEFEIRNRKVRLKGDRQWCDLAGLLAIRALLETTRFRLHDTINSPELWAQRRFKRESSIQLFCTVCKKSTQTASISNLCGGKCAAKCECSSRPRHCQSVEGRRDVARRLQDLGGEFFLDIAEEDWVEAHLRKSEHWTRLALRCVRCDAVQHTPLVKLRTVRLDCVRCGAKSGPPISAIRRRRKRPLSETEEEGASSANAAEASPEPQ